MLYVVLFFFVVFIFNILFFNVVIFFIIYCDIEVMLFWYIEIMVGFLSFLVYEKLLSFLMC